MSEEPVEGRVKVGEVLAQVLDAVGDRPVARMVVVYEAIEEDGSERIGYARTAGSTWTDQLGLLRHAEVLTEAVCLGMIDQNGEKT